MGYYSKNKMNIAHDSFITIKKQITLMEINKKFIVIGSFAALVTVCTAATVKKDEPLYTNLKVLP